MAEQTTPDTPFMQARRAYAGLIAGALSERNFWRAYGIGATAVCAGLVAVVVWQSTEQGLTPYVIEVGPDAREIRSRLATAYEPSQALHRELARQWIQMIRRVPHDPFVMETDIRWAYDRTSGPARSKLNTFFQERGGLAPHDRKTRSLDGMLVIKQSGSSFQVDWTETVFTQHGERVGTERWRALLTLERHDPKTDEEVRRNGLGLYVVDYDWQRV